jgi:hypothetical protein
LASQATGQADVVWAAAPVAPASLNDNFTSPMKREQFFVENKRAMYY